MGDNNGMKPKLPIKVKLNGGMMPTKATPFDAAYDLYVPEDVPVIYGRQKIDLGIALEIPHGYAAIIQPRSGCSLKGIEGIGVDGVTPVRIDADVLVGLVDEKFRGNIGVIIDVHEKDFSDDIGGISWFSKGSRIAQMRIVEVPDTELIEVDELDMTNDRGGGFGHTGVK